MSDQVIVIYGTREEIISGSVSVINGHNGARVYDRDMVDTRLLSEGQTTLPYFSDLSKALGFISENPKEPVQLALSEARRCNLL